jgi:transposase
MPGPKPMNVALTPNEKNILESLIRCQTTPKRLYLRAKIVLLAAEGLSNSDISKKLDSHRNCVVEWRRRFIMFRLHGLEDHDRSGRPPLQRSLQEQN